MANLDELRLMTKVARMYYERNMRQNDIANDLGLSQATISRLINSAKAEGIIRITVDVPNGVNTELEESLVQGFGLKDAIVVDCESDVDESFVQREIGTAAAHYVETIIRTGDVVGISSWSATLLALVNAMHPVQNKKDIKVVQILGGIGNPSASVHANRLTGRFSDLVRGTPYFLPAPGILASQSARQVLLDDQYVMEVINLFERVTLALVGIGDIQPSKLLTLSGNVFSIEEQELLRSRGAAGDILLRFFDAAGNPLEGSLSNRVVSMTLDQLKEVERVIAVAGGRRKYRAILGALRGKLINILVTDRCTAEHLLQSG